MEKLYSVTTESMLWCVSLTLILITLILSVSYYNLSKDTLMSANIESAVNKGIDPLAVRCSYADKQDIICVAYAASVHTTPTQTPTAPTVKK